MTQKEAISAAYEKWSKDQTPVNMTEILRQLEPTINSVSATHGVSKDENLKWSIRLHLAKQIKERYDPSKSALPTFVYQTLQRIPRMVAQQKNVIHVPESSDADIRHLQRTKQELLDKMERDPSEEEVADRAGISLQRIKSLEQRYGKPFMTVSRFQASSGGDSPPGMNIGGKATATQGLYRQYAVDTLEKTDRKIYDWLSQEAPPPKSQIASKLGISPSAVTQRVSKIENQLQL